MSGLEKMIGQKAVAREDTRSLKDMARDERIDVLAGTRGNKADHALRRSDLQGEIADTIRLIVVEELKKRGL